MGCEDCALEGKHGIFIRLDTEGKEKEREIYSLVEARGRSMNLARRKRTLVRRNCTMADLV